MSKEVLCEQLQRCRMQLPVPCSDRSNQLHHCHYHWHVTAKHLEFWNRAISYLKGLHFPVITSEAFMTNTILGLAISTSFLGPVSQALPNCLAHSLICLTICGSCWDKSALWYRINRFGKVIMTFLSSLHVIAIKGLLHRYGAIQIRLRPTQIDTTVFNEGPSVRHDHV